MRPRQLGAACIVGAYLVGMGFLGGVIVSAIRFDHRRAAILAELDDASTRVRAKLMHFEHDAVRPAGLR